VPGRASGASGSAAIIVRVIRGIPVGVGAFWNHPVRARCSGLAQCWRRRWRRAASSLGD
jgi:hypothetical protein